MQHIVLLDENHLNSQHLLSKEIKADAFIFLWDKNYFNTKNFSSKKLVFIYEALCSIDVDIYAASFTELTQHNANEPCCYYAANPQHPLFSSSLIPIEKIDSTTLLQPVEKFYKKFFPFYKAVKKQLQEMFHDHSR